MVSWDEGEEVGICLILLVCNLYELLKKFNVGDRMGILRVLVTKLCKEHDFLFFPRIHLGVCDIKRPLRTGECDSVATDDVEGLILVVKEECIKIQVLIFILLLK